MDNRKFKAVLYSGDAKTPGTVEIENRHVVFNGLAGESTQVSWDEYSISASFEDGMIGLHSTLDPAHSIFVKDLQFADAFKEATGVKIQHSFFHWFGRRPFRAAMALTALIFITAFAGLAFMRTQGKFFARFISPEQERIIGETALENQDLGRAIKLPDDVDAEWTAFLNQLLDQPELKNYKWKVSISESPVVNAFALPGGFITLNAGFINQVESANEILGVLAHEAAHVTQRHGVQSLAGAMSANILISVLFLGSSNIMSGLVFAADGLHSLKYSRAHELEADRLGVRYLQNAKIATDGMYAFFSRKRDDEPETSRSLSYLSTHPMDAERLAQIRKLDPEKSGRQIKYDLAPVKKVLEEQGAMDVSAMMKVIEDIKAKNRAEKAKDQKLNVPKTDD